MNIPSSRLGDPGCIAPFGHPTHASTQVGEATKISDPRLSKVVAPQLEKNALISSNRG